MACGVHHEHVEVRVVLGTKRLQAFLEPRTRVRRDDHGDDRRGLLLRHQGHATADARHEPGGQPPNTLAIVSNMQYTSERMPPSAASGTTSRRALLRTVDKRRSKT